MVRYEAGSVLNCQESVSAGKPERAPADQAGASLEKADESKRFDPDLNGEKAGRESGDARRSRL